MTRTMTRTLLTGLAGLAAAAVLAVLAAAPADAQQFRKQGGAYAGQPGGFNAATGNGGAQPAPQGPQRLRGNQQQPTAMPGVQQGVYAYQLWRKKHDSLIPIN